MINRKISRKQAFLARALACNIKELSTIICHKEAVGQARKCCMVSFPCFGVSSICEKIKGEVYGTSKDNGDQR